MNNFENKFPSKRERIIKNKNKIKIVHKNKNYKREWFDIIFIDKTDKNDTYIIDIIYQSLWLNLS